MTAPARRILIMVATERVSGPLKGIFQYLHYLDPARWLPLLALIRNRRATASDAELEAARLGVPFVVLEQSGPFDWRLFGEARRIARDHQIALVQSHGYKTHVLAHFIKLVMKIPWVGFEHGWTAESRRIALYHQMDRLLRFSDRVVAVSEEQRGQLQGLGVSPDRILTILNAVQADEGWSECMPGTFRIAHGIPVDVPLVAVVGRVSKEKGHRMFLEALRLLAADIPQVHAVVVGEGIDSAHVQQLAADAGLGSRVHFVGYQRPIAPVYVDSDLVVIPSTTEGVPNVLLEAMAAGCPVVATRVGGTPEVMVHDETGLLVPPLQPVALCSAIASVLVDKPLRDRLVENARRHVRSHHSPSLRAQRIADIYEDVSR